MPFYAICQFSLLITFCAISSSVGLLEELHGTTFSQFVSSNPHAIILFKSSEDCSECNDAAEIVELAQQPEMLSGSSIEKRYMVDSGVAEQHGIADFPALVYFRGGVPALYDASIEKRYMVDSGVAEQHGITDFPALVYFRGGVPALYDGKLTDASELEDWLEMAMHVAVKDLYEDTFEHLTQAASGATTGDWFIVFYEPNCSDCLKILPAVESAAIGQKHRMNFAKVDVEKNKNLAKRFKITECPRSILLRQGKMYEYEAGKYDPKSVVSFVEKWFRNLQARPVPMEPTRFDTLTESIALYLREQLQDPSRKWLIVMVIVITTTLLAFVLVCSCKRPEPRAKYD